MVLSVSLRRVFIYLLRPRWHRKSLRFAASFPMPTTPEQPDFAHGKSFVLCIFQPTKSACSAATVNRLSGVEQPLFSVSGHKRYNTLDFAGKVVCHETAGFFGFFQSKGNFIPSELPRQKGTPFPFEIPFSTGMPTAPIR